jgi:hypothetical protein
MDRGTEGTVWRGVFAAGGDSSPASQICRISHYGQAAPVDEELSRLRIFDSQRETVMAKKTKKARPWTKEDVQALRAMVREKTKTSAIARKLRRSPTATRQKAASLGVKLVGVLQRKKRA